MHAFGRSFLRALVVALAALAANLPAQDASPVSRLAIAQLQKLADAGDPAAQNELGVRFRLGTDVEKDPAKAVPWFLKAARQGYAKAYFNLGAAYYNGDGVPVDTQNSCAWFIFSADAGERRAEEALVRTKEELPTADMNRCEVLAATVYLTGDLIKQDTGKAMQWYVKAANAGDGAACEKIAYLYDRGIGVTENKQESFNWLQRSADLNYAPGIYELGMAYEAGKVVAPDLVKARKLYEQASLLAFPQAFTALGGMYAEGRGAKLDRQKALAYYIVAINYGDAAAKPHADELTAQLTTKQVAAARQDALKIAMSSKRPLLLVRK
jgi:uncharacterized protein